MYTEFLTLYTSGFLVILEVLSVIIWIDKIQISYYISVDVERHLHLFFHNKGDGKHNDLRSDAVSPY